MCKKTDGYGFRVMISCHVLCNKEIVKFKYQKKMNFEISTTSGTSAMLLQVRYKFNIVLKTCTILNISSMPNSTKHLFIL